MYLSLMSAATKYLLKTSRLFVTSPGALLPRRTWHAHFHTHIRTSQLLLKLPCQCYKKNKIKKRRRVIPSEAVTPDKHSPSAYGSLTLAGLVLTDLIHYVNKRQGNYRAGQPLSERAPENHTRSQPALSLPITQPVNQTTFGCFQTWGFVCLFCRDKALFWVVVWMADDTCWCYCGIFFLWGNLFPFMSREIINQAIILFPSMNRFQLQYILC